jgi:glyoxylase-like metal-dependent hydrolase (beta-lactamase superfamily II)
MKIAPGIHRIGSGMINSYLLEEAGEITIIDAGAPGYWNDLPVELAAMGRSFADIRALLLTHAHTDHIGFAERLRRERGVPVSVHELDAKLARGEVSPAGQSVAGARLAPFLRFLFYAFTQGLLRTTHIAEVSTFTDGTTLDVPGAPRVIHVPGHTEGSAALHLSARDVIFVGDAFVTYHVLSGARGPCISPFTADVPRAYASLARLQGIEARLALPGHGEPWTGGIGEALRQVRQAAPGA